MPILSHREREILTNFAELLIPASKEELEAVKLIDKIDDHLRFVAKEAAIAFRASLWVFEWGAFFYLCRLTRFTRMNPTWRKRYLEAWHHTSMALRRILWRFLEAIVYMNYYSIPEVTSKIGYTPKLRIADCGLRIEPQSAIPNPQSAIRNSQSPPAIASLSLAQAGRAGAIPLPIQPARESVVEDVDVCIIGSGAGGAVAAMVLAEGGRSVVVLEEGGYHAKEFGQDTVTMTKLMYRYGGLNNTFGWPAIVVPLGCVVGGTTVINSGTCFRAPSSIFTKWMGEFGLSTWTPRKMEELYTKIEKILEVSRPSEESLGGNVRIVRRGLEKLGMKSDLLLRNAPGCQGSGVCCFGCPTGAKKSVDQNFLPLALAKGARLYSNCRATRFISRKGHATQVIGRFYDGRKRIGRIEVNARVVVVACGTLFTPAFLLRSGVRDFGGHLGRNLTLHPATKVMALMDEEVRGWNEIPQSLYVDAFAKNGIMLEGIFMPPAYTASSLLTIGDKHRHAMENYNRIAIFGMMVSDTSRGSIIRLPKGRAAAIYNVNKEDLRKYVYGIGLLAKILFAAGAKKLFLPIHTIPELDAEEGERPIYTKRIHRKDLDLQAFHPLGTCRMGADPRRAVVDPFGRLYGYDNVFVADGSILPTSIGVNPMLTIMAAAWKVSEYMDREVL